MSRDGARRAAERVAAAGGTPEQIGRAYAAALPRLDNPSAPGATKARIRYRLTHWGLGGKGKLEALKCADPSFGVYTLLGKLVSVVYATEKRGDGGPAEYEHEFSRPLPELLYSDGGLVIAGGAYRVTARGIVR
jgi:hypothetical protein